MFSKLNTKILRGAFCHSMNVKYFKNDKIKASKVEY